MEPVGGYSTRPPQFTQTARSGFRNVGFRGGRRGGGGGRGYGRGVQVECGYGAASGIQPSGMGRLLGFSRPGPGLVWAELR
ncbi:hypothetical protein QJS10_CPA05g01732 [Acorus calamus]|uniref:Uncharacterized protein n=1 Tax=Acorus calamus TaxID=4465 RepID=A0AAV9EPQ6_ACOCL|nr:hypothetical protein QJS10_CPA05g01732 [Acorus calamus]